MLKRKEPLVKIIETSPNKKPKINLVLANSSIQSQQKVQSQPAITTISPGNTITVANAANKTQSITLQDLKFLSSGNKCYLPITLKDGSNNDQQVMAQIDTKNLMLPSTTYLQMKLEPQQITTTVDGQQVVQLTSAGNHLPTSISLAQPQYVQTQSSDGTIQQATIMPETRTIFTGGQNITITQNPVQQQQQQTQQTLITTMPSDQTTNDTGNKIQFATLHNVATPNTTLPLPETSAITFQRIKVEDERKSDTKSSTKQQVYKLPTLSNATIAATNTQTKTTTARQRTTAKTNMVVSTSKVNNNNKAAISIKSEANESRSNASSGTTKSSEVPTCHICEKVFFLLLNLFRLLKTS